MSSTHDELQIRIAYQDQAIEQMSQQLFALSRQVEKLALRCDQLEQNVESMKEQRGDNPTPADERPPHY